MMWCYAGTAGAGYSTLVVFDTYPVVVSVLCVASTGHRHTACTIKRVTSLIFFLSIYGHENRTEKKNKNKKLRQQQQQ